VHPDHRIYLYVISTAVAAPVKVEERKGSTQKNAARPEMQGLATQRTGNPATTQPSARPGATWEEAKGTAESGDSRRLVFDSVAVLDRVKRQGDLFAPVLTLKQRLPNLRSIG